MMWALVTFIPALSLPYIPSQLVLTVWFGLVLQLPGFVVYFPHGKVLGEQTKEIENR